MNRRGFLTSVLALSAAPAMVKARSIMRVKPVILPTEEELTWLAGAKYDFPLTDAELWIRGNMRRIIYYPNRRLSDNEIIRLTTD